MLRKGIIVSVLSQVTGQTLQAIPRQAKGDVAVKSSLKKILDESEPHK